MTDPAVVVAASTDYTGLALLTTAVGGLVAGVISAIFSGWAMINSSKAKTEAAKATAQSAETHNVVNSRMDEFKKLFQAAFKMEGKLEEKDAQALRDASGAVAVSAAATAPALIADAEAKAKALIESATAAAAKLLAEAHRVSVTNLANNPIPVKVVEGPGVDSAILVKNEDSKP